MDGKFTYAQTEDFLSREIKIKGKKGKIYSGEIKENIFFDLPNVILKLN